MIQYSAKHIPYYLLMCKIKMKINIFLNYQMFHYSCTEYPFSVPNVTKHAASNMRLMDLGVENPWKNILN